MSPMSDQPLTLGVLAQALVEFHRDVIAPDMQRIVRDSESRLRNEMQTFHDEILHRLVKLESEYHLLTVGLARVENRLDTLEAQYRDLLASVLRLEERLSRVEERLSRVEERLSRVENQLDAVVVAQEKDPLRAEMADLRARVEVLQLQVRNLEKRFER